MPLAELHRGIKQLDCTTYDEIMSGCAYLGNSHVDTTVVLADIKIEILAIHAHVTALRQVAFEATVVRAEFLEKVR